MTRGRIPAGLYRLLGQNVSIEAYGGVVAGIETYATAATVRAIVEAETDQIDRSATPGDEGTTLATLRMPLDTDCPSGSRVTLASGAVGVATLSRRWDGGAANVPSHLEVQISGAHD
jgi:hypothetical protein